MKLTPDIDDVDVLLLFSWKVGEGRNLVTKCQSNTSDDISLIFFKAMFLIFYRQILEDKL
jgi:hypothetical protein